ncbi:MAG: hypothetical protein GX316_05430 [Firmicutes bacterium]|nr:hypothetical protein [Bacillota bacterium]
MGKLKLHVILIVFLLTLALLLLGQHFILRPKSLNNIEAQFVDLPGVKDVKVEAKSEGLSLMIHFGPKGGLKSTYDKILVLAKTFGIPHHRIELKDERGPVLSAALYDIHYYIAWGMAVGDFPAMVAAVNTVLDAEDITQHEIWVDKEFIFLEMHWEQEHLYQVFSRDSTLTDLPELFRGSLEQEG